MTGLQLISIFSSALLYYGFFELNEILFSSLEQHKGAYWIFLPAGMRLLCTLILGGEGAIGLWLASLIIVSFDSAHGDRLTEIVATFISAGAPYLVYRLARAQGMPATLEKLTAKSLSILIFIYSATSSLMFSVWYTMRGVSPDFLSGFSAMLVGDLLGTIIVVYSIKWALAGIDRFRPTV